MSGHDHENASGSSLKDWAVVIVICALIVFYGLFTYFVIGDKGPPDWNFGAKKDVPGQSPYSTYTYPTDYLKK